jgi:formylglycine-generating enzyme required for sulfatase activity
MTPEEGKPGMKDILPPPFTWVDIPAGRVILIPGGAAKQVGYLKHDGTFDIPAFRIAKYPVTNSQYVKFIEDGGYQQARWWTPAGWDACQQGLEWNRDKNEREPTGKAWTEPYDWHGASLNGGNQPVAVSWYEAVAFCNWLSAATGESITLPTEQQWQRAAQGDDDRRYPWGNKWNGRCCNSSVHPYHSDRSTPVQQYEGKGDSPFGVVDMCGNVWEWCLNTYWWGATTLEETETRVLRGGCYFANTIYTLRTSARFGNDPWNRHAFGFRCAHAG